MVTVWMITAFVMVVAVDRVVTVVMADGFATLLTVDGVVTVVAADGFTTLLTVDGVVTVVTGVLDDVCVAAVLLLFAGAVLVVLISPADVVEQVVLLETGIAVVKFGVARVLAIRGVVVVLGRWAGPGSLNSTISISPLWLCEDIHIFPSNFIARQGTHWK